MGLIADYGVYLEGIKNEFAEVNRHQMVTDKSQLMKYLDSISKQDGIVLLSVLPNFGNNSPRDASTFQRKAFSEVSFLKKVDFGNLTQQNFIDWYDEIFEVANKFVNKLLNDSVGGQCVLLRQLDPKTIRIVDEYNLHQCIGWTVTFSFDII
ncbi:hypothetical protein [Altibacter sp. HG106]|uniref:hypothetical protein n=1 Tax=Altibacter sp. HG106 TaxID=3023937 RepID=UPI0023506BC0|nr:hypothetical protein [Altibacter sp. HG106]MDC7994473.1 hypothetical protein [Altibacter sp. HG106]